MVLGLGQWLLFCMIYILIDVCLALFEYGGTVGPHVVRITGNYILLTVRKLLGDKHPGAEEMPTRPTQETLTEPATSHDEPQQSPSGSAKLPSEHSRAEGPLVRILIWFGSVRFHVHDTSTCAYTLCD